MDAAKKNPDRNNFAIEVDYNEKQEAYHLEPLRPAYNFSVGERDKAVSLIQGAADIESCGDRLAGTADLTLRYLPSPRVIIRASVLSEKKPALFYALEQDASSLSFSGQRVEGFSGKRNSEANTLELDWHPKVEPVALGNMQAKSTLSATLHLFNFPDFHGGQQQAAKAPSGCSFIVLESEEWRISLQSLPDNATDQAWKRIRDEGGCFLTHVAKLERKDHKLFSGDDACEQRLLLASFLSFTKGGRCFTVCDVGFDSSGERTWELFASPRISSPPYSWFTPSQANQAEILFPLFVKRWKQSEEWKDCLMSSIYWYTQANTSNGSPGIDGAIILAQSALERLAHHHLVIDKRMISPDGLNKLKVSDRLRLLFSSLGLPLEIGDAVPELQKAASKFNWLDAPHAMTDIRNELVHPSKKKVADCFFDAWRLSLWYLELSILALCGYDKTYTSRLTAMYTTQSERVPWGITFAQ